MGFQTVGGRDRLPYPVREIDGFRLRRNPVLHDDEFVSAEARDKIRFPNAVPQPLGDRLQHRVAHIVAERIVDLLEPVHIDKVDGKSLGLLAQPLLQRI